MPCCSASVCVQNLDALQRIQYRPQVFPVPVIRRRSFLTGRPMRWAFALQIIVTVLAASLSAWFAGLHGGVSAGLGGLVSLLAGLAYAGVASVYPPVSPMAALLGLLRAEAVKIVVFVTAIWLVLKFYGALLPLAFFATFAVTVLVFSAAALFRDH